jgi:hypothetical protein
MTGLKDKNFPAFHAAAAALRTEGLEVVSPAEINAGVEHEGWEACMRRDLAHLVTCHAIYLLHGWARSRGALLEVSIGRELGFVFRRDGDAAAWAPLGTPSAAMSLRADFEVHA